MREEMLMHEEMWMHDDLPHRLRGLDHLHHPHLQDPKLLEYPEVLCDASWPLSVYMRLCMHTYMPSSC
jgi:hypothetical protein